MLLFAWFSFCRDSSRKHKYCCWSSETTTEGKALQTKTQSPLWPKRKEWTETSIQWAWQAYEATASPAAEATLHATASSAAAATLHATDSPAAAASLATASPAAAAKPSTTGSPCSCKFCICCYIFLLFLTNTSVNITLMKERNATCNFLSVGVCSIEFEPKEKNLKTLILLSE